VSQENRQRRALGGLLRSSLRPYTVRLWIITVLLLVQAGGNLYLPHLNADLINHGVVDGDTRYIWRVGGVMLGIAFGLGVMSVVTTHQASRVSMRVGADIRLAIYRRVQGFSGREISRFGISSLTTRNVNDVQQVQVFLQMALTGLVLAVLMSIGSVIFAIRESARLSILLAVAMPVMIGAISVLAAMVVPLVRVIQVRLDRINQVLREQITGARVIRAFLRTRFEQDRFRAANADMTKVALRAARMFALVMPLLIGMANLAGVGVIWFGGHLLNEGSMPIGNLTAFLIYVLQILIYLGIAITVVVLIPRAVASAERISQVLSAVSEITDVASPVTPGSVTGTVEFSHVTFGYPGSQRPVLKDLTFTLRPASMNAIIGGTGSGKTTLLSLIHRFHEVTDGAVLVNGGDVRDQAADQLLSTIGLVPQTAFLFRGTVASNLRFARPDATDGQLWRALDVAQAADFVASMPGQLDAPVDQGGTNLSGGQRQRLSIARAIVRRPRLYLFDDCFSALDAGTDARLRNALRAETADATVVLVAQRVSTVMAADQIIVLDAGTVAGIGTHRELLASCLPYREIVASQLGEEEAA
jgi:ATP-binding cassette subfamily B protein